MMEDIALYRVTVKCDDGMTLVIFTDGPENNEDIILDYTYQQHYDAQPDKSKYSVVNLTADFKELIQRVPRTLNSKLAMKAIAYTLEYQ